MPTVFVRDDLRAATEALTGGQCTVLYTAQNAPSHFFVLPKFNIEDIDPALGSGTHPAFIVNGAEVPRLFIGMHLGSVRNGELLSLPGMVPENLISIETAAANARNCGAGFHLMTNAEWAAMALWCHANGWLPGGNSEWGRNQFAGHETGVRVDGGVPGSLTGDGRTLTGSGPNSWRHNNAPNGVSDLAGNVSEWVAGIRLVEGELQILPNNDAAAVTEAFPSLATWKAVNFSTGALVSPGTSGTTKASALTPTNGANWAWAATIANTLSGEEYCSMAFSGIPSAGPALLKTLALAPPSETLLSPMGNTRVRNFGTRYMSRGDRYAQTGAGIFAIGAIEAYGITRSFIGARVAKY